MRETSGPESTNSCGDHFSYFKPSGTRKLLSHQPGARLNRVSQSQGRSPECGWPDRVGLYKGRGLNFLSTCLVPDSQCFLHIVISFNIINKPTISQMGL
jgi:hypothetical protein